MSKTVVGLFNTTAAAEQVKQALISSGYETGKVSIVANDGENTSDSAGEGIGQKISSFFSSLTGGDEHAHNHYATGVNSGGALLTVTTADEDANAVAALLKQHGARDIDGGYQSAAEEGTPVYGGSANANTTGTMTGQTAIPIVEEELVVGKREVDRGGVRIYSHVVERPVTADVTLRDESINVQRRAVDRAATAADFTSGNESFELRASGEEAVIGKNSRVVEEVLIGKEASSHTENISDTVRRTEVDVEEIPGQVSSTTDRNRY